MFCTQAGPGCSTVAELGLAQAPGDTWGQGGSPWGSHQRRPPEPPRASKPPRGEPCRSCRTCGSSSRTFYIQPSAPSSLEGGGGGGGRKGREGSGRNELPQLPHPHHQKGPKKKRFKSKNRTISCCQPAVVTARPVLLVTLCHPPRGKAGVESRLCHKHAASHQE